MTSPHRPGRLNGVGAWLLTLLATVGLLVLGAGTASAHTPPDAGNRVRASAPETITAVGVSEHIAAGQGRGPPASQPRFVVATGVAAEAGAARFITTPAGVTIDRAAVSMRVSAQRQGRHVLGDRNYKGGSYFNSADDAQGVLDAFHGGSAEVLGVKGNDIVVRAPGITGFNHNPRSGFPNQPTDVFFIKGSTSPSVVPYNPAWTP